MNIQEIFAILFIIIGMFFILVAGIGILRLPDLFLRMSATTKAATLGVGFMLVGTAFHFRELEITTRALAIIAFVMLTAPVSAHMIARAGHFYGVPLWEHTVIDEMQGHYDKESHILTSPEPEISSQESKDEI
ncbi:MAG: monovalent cation/H(+) antiporter subunit G [Anaerolineaceae bacterium]|nr:monovalent cation/H(+) antiporter subunit G [Anaerolineaceae bacterium]